MPVALYQERPAEQWSENQTFDTFWGSFRGTWCPQLPGIIAHNVRILDSIKKGPRQRRHYCGWGFFLVESQANESSALEIQQVIELFLYQESQERKQ